MADCQLCPHSLDEHTKYGNCTHVDHPKFNDLGLGMTSRRPVKCGCMGLVRKLTPAQQKCVDWLVEHRDGKATKYTIEAYYNSVNGPLSGLSKLGRYSSASKMLDRLIDKGVIAGGYISR